MTDPRRPSINLFGLDATDVTVEKVVEALGKVGPYVLGVPGVRDGIRALAVQMVEAMKNAADHKVPVAEPVIDRAASELESAIREWLAKQ